MSTVGAFEAKTHLSQLLQRVAAGEEITITIHGHAVASLVPYAESPRRDRQAAIDRLRELSTQVSLGGESLKELIAEGRRF